MSMIGDHEPAHVRLWLGRVLRRSKSHGRGGYGADGDQLTATTPPTSRRPRRLLQLLGEEVGVVDDLALEEPVELFGIDAGGPPGAQRRLLTRVVPVRQSGRVPSLHWVNRSPQRGQLDGR